MMQYLHGINGLHLVSTALGVWLLTLVVRRGIREYRMRKNIRRRLEKISRGDYS